MNLVMYLWIVSLVAAILFIAVVMLMMAMASAEKHQSTEGVEVKAEIIAIEIRNEAGRRVPFVRMKLAVQAAEPFVTTVEEFYPAEELPYIRLGSQLAVVYHPLEKTCRLLSKRLAAEPVASRWRAEPMLLANQNLSAA